MMMNRRFVNLVLKNYTSNMYALHRLDVTKHLFYPCTAEAEAAHAAKENEINNGGGSGGGGKPKPLRIERLRQLPPLITGFKFSLSPTRDQFVMRSSDMFVVLHGGSEPGSRIFHANGAGHATLYDADSRSVVCVPDLAEKGFRPMLFVVPGAGAGEEDESLYVLRSVLVEPTNHQCSRNFEVLDFHGGSGGAEDSFLYQKQPLPSPPLSPDNLESSTVIDGGRTICVSSESKGGGTFCFDTATREWRHAGDWILPFCGRGEYLPELDTWVGFSPDHPHHLCSTDLTGIAAMDAAAPRQGAPTLQHVWEDFNPPANVETSLVLNKRFPGIVHRTSLEWTAWQLHLVTLGSGRLCIAKVFEAMETVSLSCSFDDYQEPKGKLTVLVGVELLRGGDGGLRMVKHKTKRFVFPGNSIHCVL